MLQLDYLENSESTYSWRHQRQVLAIPPIFLSRNSSIKLNTFWSTFHFTELTGQKTGARQWNRPRGNGTTLLNWNEVSSRTEEFHLWLQRKFDYFSAQWDWKSEILETEWRLGPGSLVREKGQWQDAKINGVASSVFSPGFSTLGSTAPIEKLKGGHEGEKQVTIFRYSWLNV